MWISFKDKLPELNSMFLVYKTMPAGGYYEGIYVATYQQLLFTRPMKITYHIVLEEMLETNKNNYRDVKEFSHWMPLPYKP